jgi:thymidylate synthase
MNGVELINATTLDDAWFQALSKVMGDKGRQYLIEQGSYEGIERSGMKLIINIFYPGSRPLAPIVPEGIPPPTDKEKIEAYLEKLITNIKAVNEHYTYGEDLWWEYEWVIKHFKQGFGTNHCYMAVGRPETLFFYDRNVDYDEFIVVKDRKTGDVLWTRYITNSWNKNLEIKTSSQCLRGIDSWIEEGKLHFMPYFRSWDLWGGFPENLGGIQLLKEDMAKQIGVEDGMMIVSCKDLHVYEHTWAVAYLRLRKEFKDKEEV